MNLETKKVSVIDGMRIVLNAMYKVQNVKCSKSIHVKPLL